MNEFGLTPWKNIRFGVFGLGISLILGILGIFLPFYSYSYFFTNETLTFLNCVSVSSEMIIPFVFIACIIVFYIIGISLMLFASKSVAGNKVANILIFISGLASFALFIISICRLWVIPYEFAFSSAQRLEIGYFFYCIFLAFQGVLCCYVLALSNK